MSDYTVGETIDHKFTTRAFATGIPTVLSGSPVIEVYEDNSTTQITVGETLTVDFDSVVGLNHLRIVATGANGYESGKSYQAIISVGTVGGVSVVGEVVWEFTLGRSAAAVDLANGTDGIGAIKAETALILTDTGTTLDGKINTIDTNVDSILVDTGTTLQAELDAIQAAVITNAAGVDIAADIIAVKAETATILVDTGTTLDGKIDTIDANVDLILVDTGTTLQAELDAIQAAVITNAAGVDIAADIIAIKAETVNILADTDDIGVAGAGLTAIPISDANLTQIGGVVQSATDLKDFADAGYDPVTNKVQGVVLVDTTTALTTNNDKTDYALTTAEQDAIVDKVWDEVLTGGTHNITNSAGRRLRILQENLGYEGGAVWVDTVNGTAGTTSFENGTAQLPVLTWADALTIATNVGLNRFEIVNGSTITLSANSDNFSLVGENWTLALGAQSIANAYFEGSTDVSGISSGATPRFHRCHIKTCSLNTPWVSESRLAGTITLLAIGGNFFQACYATTGTIPIIDLDAALGAQTVCLTPITGGIQFNNSKAGDLIHIEGHGEFTLDSTCTAGTVEYAGNFRVTDNSTGMTINADDNTAKTAVLATNIPDVISLANINAEVADVINTDTSGEPAQGIPAATASLRTKIDFLYKNWRNRKTQTATQWNLFNDNATTIDHKSTVSDDATTADKTEIISGP